MAKQSVFNDDTARLVKKRMQLSREYTQPYFDRFLDNYKHYFLRIIDEAVEADPEAYPFYSQMTIPISYQVVETNLPKMFIRLPTFQIETDFPNDEEDEQGLASLIRYQMNHPYLIDDPIFLRLATAAKEMFITGNAWGMTPWYTKEAEVEEWQPTIPLMGINEPSWENLAIAKQWGVKVQWQLVKVKKKLIDAPVFTHKSMFHVFPDPKKKRVSDLKYATIEEMMTMNEILDMVNVSPGEYKNIDELKRMKAMKQYNTDDNQMNYDQEMAEIFGSSDFSTKDDSKDQGQFKVHMMLEPDKLSIVVNERLTIRKSGNPNGDGKLGLFLMKDIPIPHELYAWGEPDPIKKIEDGMTDQANMRNDNVFYDLLRMWKLDPNALVEGENFVPEPGTVVQLKDMNGLQPLETGTTKASPYREYQEWDKIIQNTTAASDYATGAVDPGMNKTLGGVEKLQQAANSRFMMKLQLFEQLGLKAMGTMYVQRNMRFYDEPQFVKSEENNEKMVITHDQVRRIRGAVHFVVETGSTESMNRDKELEKWKFVNDQIAGNKAPFDNLTQAAKDRVAKKTLIALGETHPNDIIQREQIPKTPPQPQGVNGAVNILSSLGAGQQPNVPILAGEQIINAANQPNPGTVPPGITG